ncbi:jg20372, partial [Pararge aegeria aegeria]
FSIGRIDEDIDVEDLIRRYTSDVIASAAFGLQVDSVKDKENKFYKAGQNLFNFNAWQRFLFFFTAVFPNLSKIKKPERKKGKKKSVINKYT